EAEHAEPGLAHGRQALLGHRIDAVRADELQVRRDRTALFRRDDRFAERQNAAVLGEDEDIVLEDDRAYFGMSADDALDHPQAFFGVEASYRRDAALRLVEKIRRRTERASQRAVIHSDESHGTNL